MRNDAGFTLLETLVALIVLGFVMAGLAQGLQFGLTAWDGQARRIDRDGALDATDRTLRRLLAGMMPGNDPQTPTVVGSADRLAFIAHLPQGAPAGPIRLADMQIATDAAHRLVLRWAPHLHATQPAPPATTTTVLLPGVATLQISYFGAADKGVAPGWTASWRGAVLPSLVRIHLSFVDTARHWPDLIAAPMQEADAQ